MKIRVIKISDIKISDRNRKFNRESCKELADSIQKIGLLQPIVIDNNYNLIAGLHRLEAARILGWEEIPCQIVYFDELNSEIAEIDENLIRADLLVLERADLLARRQEIYELLHPETKAGVSQVLSMHRHLGHNVTEFISATPAFAKNIAGKAKVSERKIRQEIQISKNILPEIKNIIGDTNLADSKVDLINLCRLEGNIQKEVVNKIQKGEANKVKDALYLVKKENINRQFAKAEQATAQADIGIISNDIELSAGDVFKLGNHILICGDNTDPAVIEYLRQFHFSFCFADPPYGAGYADYDMTGFSWSQDYISEIADIVVVIPGIMSIADFLKLTNMPYRWALACHIKNLHSACSIGYTHWYFTAIFSNLTSINRCLKDYIEITLPLMPAEDKNIAYKRQKPAAYLTWLIDMFSKQGDLILDPFAGSGQTLIVCEVLNRECVTVEILPDMVKAIIDRFENKFGVKAIKINNLQVKK